MKKHTFHILLLAIIPVLFVTATAQIQQFQKTFGSGQGAFNNKMDYATAIKQTTDGGYIVTGYSDGSALGLEDIYLVRFSATGDTLWSKVFGGSNKDFGRSVVQTSDGSFAVCGETQSFGVLKNDAFLMKTDANGSLLWAKTFGGAEQDYAYSLLQTSDGGFLLAGSTISFGNAAGYEDVYLIKTDATGNVQWTKTYGGSGDDAAYNIQPTADGGYIITGEEGSVQYGVLLMKINASGDSIWVKTVRGNYGGYGGYDVKQTTDGGYILAGYTSDSTFGSYDWFLVKTNSTGNVTWAKCFGSSSLDEARSVVQCADGGFSIAGYTYVNSQYSRMHLVKTNANGTLLWEKAYNSNYGNEGWKHIQTSDDGFAIAGYIYNNFGNTLAGVYQSYDGFLVKTNSLGESPGCVTNSPGISSKSFNWNSYPASLTKGSGGTASTPTMLQKYSKTNLDNAGLKLGFTTTNIDCGTGCTGTAAVNHCDSGGFYCSGVAPYTYTWSGSQTDQTATGLCSGSYTVTVTDNMNCKGTGAAFITTQALPVPICEVTVDTTSTKNEIIWEKPNTSGIDSFRIYREITGIYTHIGSVAYSSLSKFIDNTTGVNPNITSYKYKISVVDTCGNQSALSVFHKTIHLTYNQGTGGAINLIWDNYSGFLSSFFYRIVRQDSTGYLQAIDSVSNTNFTFTIQSPVYNSNYFIEIVHPGGGCSATKSAENHNTTRSNKTMALAPPSGIGSLSEPKTNYTIYPVPNQGIFTVELFNIEEGITVQVISVLGQVVWKQHVVTDRFNIELPPDSKGVYLLKIVGKNEVLNRTVVVH